jgi:hypothetical protein
METRLEDVKNLFSKWIDFFLAADVDVITPHTIQ